MATPPNPSSSLAQPKLLTSWKEIAEFLDVTVRTAQKWEHQRGLPIRRLPGGRGRVIASIPELEVWLLESRRVRSNLSLHRLGFFGLLSVVCVLISAGAWYSFSKEEQFIVCQVDQGQLIVREIGGRELWRKNFGIELTDYVESARKGWKSSWVGDLDGDGELDVLFLAVARGSHAQSCGGLYCYSRSGKQKWSFVPSSAAWNFPKNLQPPYCPLNMEVFRSSGQMRVAVASVHNTLFPGNISILSASGKELRGYWHSGHLPQLLVADLWNMGRPMLIAGGVANGFGAGAIVVLDPESDDMNGASKEISTNFRLPMPRAQERVRVLFPRSPISTRKGPYNPVIALRMVQSELQVAVQEDLQVPAEVIHTFGPGLEYRGAVLSSNYIGRRNELRNLGLLRTPFQMEDETAGVTGVRWLTGNPNGIPTN